MKNAQFEKDIEVIPSLFNKLQIVKENDEKFLSGQLDIIDKHGKLWDTYTVEIKGTPDYPHRFPKLFETGGAFPKILDWHVYEFDDKSCCVDVPPNEFILCRNEIHVKDYIPTMAIPYLANQSFRIREGYYLYGEYSHGVEGRIEFYQAKLKAKRPAELLRMFEFLLLGVKMDRTAECPFCPGKKFRKCHRQSFEEFEIILPWLNYDWGVLKAYFSSHPNYKLPGNL